MNEAIARALTTASAGGDFSIHHVNLILECQNILKKMDEINVIGRMDHTIDHTLESANRVYGTDGIAPTIPTCAGGVLSRKSCRYVP